MKRGDVTDVATMYRTGNDMPFTSYSQFVDYTEKSNAIIAIGHNQDIAGFQGYIVTRDNIILAEPKDSKAI